MRLTIGPIGIERRLHLLPLTTGKMHSSWEPSSQNLALPYRTKFLFRLKRMVRNKMFASSYACNICIEVTHKSIMNQREPILHIQMHIANTNMGHLSRFNDTYKLLLNVVFPVLGFPIRFANDRHSNQWVFWFRITQKPIEYGRNILDSNELSRISDEVHSIPYDILVCPTAYSSPLKAI